MLKIVIPYRDRKKHFDISIRNFPIFFDNYYKDNYQIHIVEQYNDKKFNLAKIINVGYKTFSFNDGDSFLYHPVDHWPSKGNFDCPENSFKILISDGNDTEDNYHYIFAFINIIKTIPRIRAFSICPKLFKILDGYQTMFEGWGAEDNAFFFKIMKHCTYNNIFFEKISWLIDEIHQRDKENNYFNKVLLQDYYINESKYSDYGLKNSDYNLISKEKIAENIILHKVDWK